MYVDEALSGKDLKYGRTLSRNYHCCKCDYIIGVCENTLFKSLKY